MKAELVVKVNNRKIIELKRTFILKKWGDILVQLFLK